MTEPDALTSGVPLTFGRALRMHRCYSTDHKCFVCGAYLPAVKSGSDAAENTSGKGRYNVRAWTSR